MPSTKTRTTKRSTPTEEDPRQLGPVADRMAAMLERDTARGERDGDRQDDPHDWPAWTDNWLIGLTD